MSLTFFAVGAVIFAAYMYFTVWNINNGAKKGPTQWPTHGSEGCDPPAEPKD